MDDDLLEPAREGLVGEPWSDKLLVGKHRTFDGVVVDSQVRILLREAVNPINGSNWIYPKGRPDPG